MEDISIILISYKSENKIYDFVKKIPKKLKVIIIENSGNYKLKNSIENTYKNVSVYIRQNNGVSAALNFAVKKIKTKYFLQISPDINFKFGELKIYLDYANKLNNNFAAIGPRFLNVKKRSHKQIDEKLEYNKISSIHGSCMFINKKCYEKIGGFDESFFLYFEETDYCFRGKKNNFFTYQINKSTVSTNGRSVQIDNKAEEEDISHLLIWHFIWSKFYFSTKKYGKLFSIIIFLPLLIRIFFKIILYSFVDNKILLKKYKFRLDGLIKSIIGKNSNLRP